MSTPPARPFRRVAVVGGGLIGGSFALACQALDDVEGVLVVDRDPAVVAEARSRGVGTRWSTDVAEVRDCDLVVLSVPVPALVGVARAVRPHLADGAVVTDVGSVKGQVAAALAEALGGAYLGGHPMAGSERSGVAAAQARMFQGATWLLTPGEHADQATFHRLATHLGRLGARVLAVPTDLHDDLVAIASHLPQALASVLMGMAESATDRTGRGLLAVAAGGFRDVTRVAASDPDLWVGILRENRHAFLHAVDAFGVAFEEFRAAVHDGDWDRVRADLDRARAARRSLPRKEVGDVLVDLVVPIPDRPGALAEVTTALGTAGINIEDVSMRHAAFDDRGAMVIAVDGHRAADAAITLLSARGYEAHPEVRG